MKRTAPSIPTINAAGTAIVGNSGEGIGHISFWNSVVALDETGVLRESPDRCFKRASTRFVTESPLLLPTGLTLSVIVHSALWGTLL